MGPGIIKILGPNFKSSDAGGKKPCTRMMCVVAISQPAFLKG